MNNNNSNKNAHQHHYAAEFSLFVGDLPYDCSDEKLQRLFQSKFKSVKRVQIIRNEDGSSRGFGFIRFEERADFQAALAEGMKIDNTTLRLDTAHRSYKNGRTRFNSFNSTGSNNSSHHNHHQFNNSNSNLHHQHHHHHHHNQGHHHHHNQAHQQHGSQQHHPSSQQGQNNKIILPDQTIGGQQHHQGPHGGAGGSSSSNVSASGSGGTSGNSRVSNDPLHHTGIGAGVPVAPSAPSAAAVHHHTHALSQQTPHTQSHTQHGAHPSLFNTPQQKNNQRHIVSENRGPKPVHGQGGDDTVSISQTQNKQQPTRPSLHQQTQQQTQSTPLSQSQTQQNLSQLNSSAIGVAVPSVTANITATTSASSLSSSDVLSHSTSALLNTQHNINTGQPSLGPDLRGYAHTAMMDNPHMMNAADQQSVMPPSSMYGHMYPYGPPPPFGYMPPPPQPNPVIPISAVPPAPPNQASSSGVGQQHSLTAASGNRYNNTHHQQQHHPHQTQQAHATAQDANAMNTMTAGVQAPPPHQAPFYYYYPNPLYFDQTGAGAPPNLYHPQSFHPQFFALPNPAYLPNAHTYTNQHQTQPPLASQSDASATLVNQQQPQPQSHQQQVNLRTRDIDAPIE